MKHHLVAAAGLSLLLAGCATPPNPALVAAAQRPVTCQAGADCDAKWSRAVNWVIQNSYYKIQTQTEQMVETFGPFDASPQSAMTITKVAETPTTYAIEFTSACDNFIGCIPSGLQLEADFKSYVLQTP